MKCQECGVEFQQGHKFCPNCGKGLSNNNTIPESFNSTQQNNVQQNAWPYSQVKKKHFYETTWFMWVMLIFFAPVGIFLLWKYKKFNEVGRAVITAVFASIFLLVIVSNNGKQNTQTVANKPVTNQTSTTSQQPTVKATPLATPTPTAVPTPTPTPKYESIKPGMYKVGPDIQPGEYVIISDGSMGYMQVARDSTGQLSSIICNEIIKTRTIVTIKEGEYFSIKGGKTYLIDKAPKVITNDNKLGEGMYKVGLDINPGEYKVTADGQGYIEVSKDSSHILGGIISNDIFEGEKYITIKQGQYLKLTNAYLKLK